MSSACSATWDMFSTTPRTFVDVLRQKFNSLRTSCMETSCGVVTTTAPSTFEFFKYCTTLMCSSDVPGGVSIIRKSRSPQSTSVRNCLMSPFLRGPRHMTALSSSGSMKPTDMTPRPPAPSTSTYTGDQPLDDWCTDRPFRPSMRGTDGPQMSTSSSPTSKPREASAKASWQETVDLPTPPLPERTRSLCLTLLRRSLTRSGVGSTALPAPEAHAEALGQPAHAEALPAASDAGPTQPSFAAAASIIVSYRIVSYRIDH
mmetsp:Transcript_15325/g.51545  ORF Transcript_15325/g.51545 Transcript_15325/m.51545 type:complete len:259 (+) Transcript_15325:433-1209(+)